MVGEGLERLQQMKAQPQVLRDHGRVPGVGLGPRDHLSLPPGLDGIGRHRHHRVPSLEETVHQPAVGALDRHRQPARLTEHPKAGHQLVESLRRVLHHERCERLAGIVMDGHGMLRGCPVDSCEQHLSRHLLGLPTYGCLGEKSSLPGGH